MPATIVSAVGWRKPNQPKDVKVIHDLLARVPAANGGPGPGFDPNAAYGPLTDQMILTFQKKNGLTGDAVVDPNKRTLAMLNQLATGPAPFPGSGANPPNPPAGPAPLEDDTIRKIVEIVRSNLIAAGRIDSIVRVVPGGLAGSVRNMLMVFADIATLGRNESWNGSPGTYDLATKWACTGIAEAASHAIQMNRHRVPEIASAGSHSRFKPIPHDAVLVKIRKQGFVDAEYVLDWHASLDVRHPYVSKRQDWDRGGGGYRFPVGNMRWDRGPKY